MEQCRQKRLFLPQKTSYCRHCRSTMSALRQWGPFLPSSAHAIHVATSNGTASTHEDRLPGTQPSEAAGFPSRLSHPHVAKMQRRVARRQHRPIHLIGRGLRPTRNPQMQNGVTIVNIGWSPRRSRAGTKLGRLKLSRCDWGTYASTTAGSTQGARWHGICCLSHRRMGFS